jgi:alkylated DNA repair dioxygenase AlkB
MSQMSGGYSTRTKSEREFSYQATTTLKVHPLNVSVYGEVELDDKFVDSIKNFGVLEPILIARLSFDGANYSDYILSGHRRFAAAQKLGMKKVPVREWTASEGLRNPIALLDAEVRIIEANRQRIKTESQKDAEAAALLRIEKALAATRQQAGVRLNSDEGGKAVEKVAAITGESPDTVRKRSAIHDAKIPSEERNKQSTHAAFENLPKPTSCDICQQEFESKGAMSKHRRKEHADEMSNRKPSKPYEFLSPETLVTDAMKAQDEWGMTQIAGQAYLCTRCMAWFPQQSWNKHVREKHTHPIVQDSVRPCFKTSKSPNGHTMFVLLSWLQKSIRRGHLGDNYVDDALYAAVELDLTGFPNAVWNRLFIIASEDIGQADRLAIVETQALFLSYQHLRRTGNKHLPERLPLVDAVLRLAMAPQTIPSERKSRMVDHALNVVYNDRSKRTVPEYVFDKHVAGGTGGVEEFLDTESAAPIVDPDRWLEDAKRILVAKESGGAALKESVRESDPTMQAPVESVATWMRHGKPSTVEQCKAIQKKGARCQNESYENGYCGQHKAQAKDWIDYQPTFLSTKNSDGLFSFLNSQPLSPETGSCILEPTHDSLQWGPRQAYLKCVPENFRIKSSGEIPEFMMRLHNLIQEKYSAAFNSIQVNRHWNENSLVAPHSDNMHGDIVMLSVGAPRRFILRHKKDDKAKAARWKAGDIYFDEVLPHGSLLTIFKAHQFDLTHEMPKSDVPCGTRISIIWRYLTESVVKGPLGRGSLMAGSAEFKQAQQTFQTAAKSGVAA